MAKEKTTEKKKMCLTCGATSKKVYVKTHDGYWCKWCKTESN